MQLIQAVDGRSGDLDVPKTRILFLFLEHRCFQQRRTWQHGAPERLQLPCGQVLLLHQSPENQCFLLPHICGAVTTSSGQSTGSSVFLLQRGTVGPSQLSVWLPQMLWRPRFPWSAFILGMRADNERQSACECVRLLGSIFCSETPNVLHNDEHAHTAWWLLCRLWLQTMSLSVQCEELEVDLCTSDMKTGFALTESWVFNRDS